MRFLERFVVAALLGPFLLTCAGCDEPAQSGWPTSTAPATTRSSAGVAAGAFAPSAGNWETRETKVLDFSETATVVPKSWQVSPDGRRFAYAVQENEACSWMVDGKDRVLPTLLNKQFGVQMHGNHQGYFSFSGDGKHYFIAKHFGGTGETAGFLDGREVHKWDRGVVAAWLNHEGTEYAWAVDGRNLIVNGKEVASVARGENSSSLVAMGYWSPIIHVGKTFTWIKPDGLNVAAVKEYALTPGGYAILASEENQQFAIVNGKPQKRFTSIQDGSMVMSEDGKHYALIGVDGGKHYVQYDNVWHELPAALTAPRSQFAPLQPAPTVTLSPDGKRWACVGVRTAFIDGKLGKTYLSTGPVVFRPDSQAYAFAAVTSERVEKPRAPGQKDPVFENHVFPVIVKDGVEHRIAGFADKVTDDFGLTQAASSMAGCVRDLAYSPNGAHLAYVVTREGGKRSVMVDDARIGKGYEALHESIRPTFSPDSTSLAYVVRQSGEWCVVLDGQERKGFDLIGFEGTRVGYTPAGSFTYLAKREGSVFWVEETRKKP